MLAGSAVGVILVSLAAAAQEHGPWRASERNTRGWQLMTPEERVEHQARIRGFKTYDECRDYQAKHHQMMEERARQRGATLPPSRRELCGHLRPAGNEKELVH